MKKLLLLLILAIPFSVFCQYSETFTGQNGKGAQGLCSNTQLSSCASNDLSGVTWTLTGNFGGLFDSGDNGGYVVGEALNWQDNDVEICWESPTLDLSAAGGSFDVTLDISNNGFDFGADACGLNVNVDNGGFTLVDDYDGSEATLEGTGIVGTSTVILQVCVRVNVSSETITIDNISVPTANVTILPIELISFISKVTDEKLTLEWITATELNNEKFEIEESYDGRKFQKIGEIVGNGTTVEQQEYSFKVESPRKGISYYRLKQIDYDGQFEYSEVISINFKGENGQIGGFYPNPSKSGLVNLDYTSNNGEEITISVFDVTGRLVDNQIQQVSRGDNNLSFDFSNLNTGIYIVKIGDERNPTHRKLLIEK